MLFSKTISELKSQVATLTAERDTLKAARTASPDLAAVTAERDTLRARVRELEAKVSASVALPAYVAPKPGPSAAPSTTPGASAPSGPDVSKLSGIEKTTALLEHKRKNPPSLTQAQITEQKRKAAAERLREMSAEYEAQGSAGRRAYWTKNADEVRQLVSIETARGQRWLIEFMKH